jgi:hypothetical protein
LGQKPCNGLENGRFPCTAWAKKGENLAILDDQGKVGKNFRTFFVANPEAA